MGCSRPFELHACTNAHHVCLRKRGEGALVKCLLCEHGDLSSDPRDACKKWGKEEGWEDPRSLLISQSRQTD